MSRVHSDIASYYDDKLRAYGETPRGVDWNGEEGQFLRFRQLSQIISVSKGFSLNDLGCGFGSLFDYLRGPYSDIDYLGVDVSREMIDAAKRRNASNGGARFRVAEAPDRVADFGVASGIFNVRLQHDDGAWLDHVHSTLDVLHSTSRFGFAFNCLTSYSDFDRMRPDLYYADPCGLFHRCKSRYARNVALLHDYGLYEFTILVRKADAQGTDSLRNG